MKRLATLLLCLAAGGLQAARFPASPMSPPAFADTEVSTNVTLGGAVETEPGDGVGFFDVELSLRATPTNNVEICLGRDTDGDGELGPLERDFVLGWDSGAWFWRDRRSNARGRFGGDTLPDDCRTLHWRVDLNARRRPRRFVAREGDAVLAGGPATEAMYSALWTHGRIVARGPVAHDESVSVRLSPRGLRVVIE